MGNCSSDLRRYIRHNDVAGVLRVVQEAGDASPDLINEDFTADCILDSCQRNQDTPLHTVLKSRQIEIMEILLKYGADPNAPSRCWGQTPLHLAARQNNTNAATVLVKYGADPSVRDDDGRLPIHCAAGSLPARMRSNVDMLRYLTEEARPKIDEQDLVRITDDSGDTPLHYAVRTEHLQAVRYLLEHGANMNDTNKRGQSPKDLAKGEFKLNLEAL